MTMELRLLQEEPTIIGEWEWHTTEMNFLPGGWAIMSELLPDEHIWHFHPERERMTSYYNGDICYDCHAFFSAKHNRLTLEGYTFDRDGNPDLLINEEYRVEFPSPDEMILYDLEDVAIGLEDESPRLCFRRK